MKVLLFRVLISWHSWSESILYHGFIAAAACNSRRTCAPLFIPQLSQQDFYDSGIYLESFGTIEPSYLLLPMWLNSKSKGFKHGHRKVLADISPAKVATYVL